jgi:hypothetical protein
VPKHARSDGIGVGIPSDLDSLAHFLRSHGQQYYTEGWTAYRLTPDRVALLLAMGSVALVGKGSIEAAAIATFTGRRPVLRLGLLVGSHTGMERLARWLPSRAAGMLDSVRGQVALADGTLEALDATGYRTDFEHKMLLHELPLA